MRNRLDHFNSPTLWGLSDDSPPRWAKLFAGLLLGGVTVACALAIMRSSKQQPETEPTISTGPEPSRGPVSESNWTSGEVALKVDGVEIFGLTHLGKARSNNQDTFRLYPLPELGSDYALLLVCDGMGGHAGGEVASDLAATLISGVVNKQRSNQPERLYECLSEALHRADAAIEQRASKERKLNGMGTTAVAAVICMEGYVHCYIGDSRLYQVDGDEITYMTRDHSVVRLLLEEGIISEAEVKNHPYRSQLTSSLGGGKDANRLTVEPKWRADRAPYREWKKGSWLLLCSDGLNSELSNDEIEQILTSSKDPAEAARALLARTLETEAKDNVTIVVARRV
jgi:serine/threonine protein phosphatase PrpC